MRNKPKNPKHLNHNCRTLAPEPIERRATRPTTKDAEPARMSTRDFAAGDLRVPLIDKPGAMLVPARMVVTQRADGHGEGTVSFTAIYDGVTHEARTLKLLEATVQKVAAGGSSRRWFRYIVVPTRTNCLDSIIHRGKAAIDAVWLSAETPEKITGATLCRSIDSAGKPHDESATVDRGRYSDARRFLPDTPGNRQSIVALAHRWRDCLAGIDESLTKAVKAQRKRRAPGEPILPPKNAVSEVDKVIQKINGRVLGIGSGGKPIRMARR